MPAFESELPPGRSSAVPRLFVRSAKPAAAPRVRSLHAVAVRGLPHWPRHGTRPSCSRWLGGLRLFRQSDSSPEIAQGATGEFVREQSQAAIKPLNLIKCGTCISCRSSAQRRLQAGNDLRKPYLHHFRSRVPDLFGVVAD